MFWSKEEFRTVIWHTKITCKITQKVVLLVLVLRVRWKNTIKIEKKIVKKRYYLDLLNEGSQRGGLGQGDGLDLSVVVSVGCLRFFVPWASTVLARAIDITSAGAPASIKKLSNRNKRKETIITNPKEEQRWSYMISRGVARPGLGRNQHHWCAHLSFFGREEQWQKQVGVSLNKWGSRWGRSEGWVERKLREKSEMIVASSVQLTARKEGVLWFDSSLGITAAVGLG